MCITRGSEVLDVGCCKGRYLKNLLENAPNNHYYGVDIGVTGMNLIKGG